MNCISIEINHLIRRAYIAEYIATLVDSDLLLYFPELKVFTSFNSSASLLWRIWENYMNQNKPITEEELYKALSLSYPDVTADKAAESMQSFCNQLISAGVLRWEE